MNSHQRRVARRAAERAMAAEWIRWDLPAPAIHLTITPDLEAFMRICNPVVATGAMLDALCNIPIRPFGMTDDELRHSIEHSMVLSDLLFYGNSQHIENDDGSITHVPLKLPE